LGLPDRDYYLSNEPRFAEAREKYRAHVATVLTLGGMSDAEVRASAPDIVSLEKRLAEASWTARRRLIRRRPTTW